jgi:hypothetical protein
MDKALQGKAASDSQNPAPRYWCLGNNCWRYADSFVNLANGMNQPPPIDVGDINAPPKAIGF